MTRTEAIRRRGGRAAAPRWVPAAISAAFVLSWFAVAVMPSNVHRAFGGIVLGGILGAFVLLDRNRRTRRLLVLLLALAPLTQAVFYYPALWNRSLDGTDARVYWRAAQRAEDPESRLYVRVPDGPHVYGSPDYYLYPPFLAVALSVLPDMSERAFDRFWVAAMLGMLWLFAAALSVLATGALTTVGVLGWGMAVSLWPGALFGALIGNVEPMLWALAAVALASTAIRAGAFTFSALIKPYAIWPALVSIARDRRPATRSAGGAIAAAAAVSFVVLGLSGTFSATADWLVHIYPSLSQGQLAVPNPDFWWITGNLSLSFAPLKVAHYVFGWQPAGDLPTVLRLYLTTASVVPVLITAWVARRRSVALHTALVLCAAVAFGPICRMSYTPVFLTVIAAWRRERRMVAEAAVPAIALGPSRKTADPMHATVAGQSLSDSRV